MQTHTHKHSGKEQQRVGVFHLHVQSPALLIIKQSPISVIDRQLSGRTTLLLLQVFLLHSFSSFSLSLVLLFSAICISSHLVNSLPPLIYDQLRRRVLASQQASTLRFFCLFLSLYYPPCTFVRLLILFGNCFTARTMC